MVINIKRCGVLNTKCIIKTCRQFISRFIHFAQIFLGRPVLPEKRRHRPFSVVFRRPAVPMAALSSMPFSPRAKVVFNATCWCGWWGMEVKEGGDLDGQNVRLTAWTSYRLCGGWNPMGFIWHPWDERYILPDMNGGIFIWEVYSKYITWMRKWGYWECLCQL